MKIWAGSAHFKGYEATVTVHCVVALNEAEAKRLVLEEATKNWPEWWHNYPYTIKVLAVPSEVIESVFVGDEDR